jgi:pimeloyl-ACP methyl ester carboxylesterase
VSGTESVTIDVGDLAFDVVTAGRPGDPVVLLLHGFPQTSWCWRHQIDPLSRAGYHVIAPNQRGYSPGARPTSIEAYASHHLVADAVAMLDWGGADRAHVVGHDWGASIAWQLAGRHGDRLLSMTALSVPHPLAYTAALQDPASDQAERSWYFDWFAGPDAAGDFLADDRAQLRSVFTATGLSQAEADVYVDALGTPEALDGALNWYRATGIDLIDGLGPVTVPTMHVWSTDDVALGPEGARATADFVEGPYRYEQLDGVNHWIPELAPEATTDLLLDHFRTAAHS